MNQYTCTDYRLEMILLGLNRKLNDPHVDPEEKDAIRREILRIEEEMDRRADAA
ncbi:hypothetical protein [Desulfatirhabdium butyrativorans]|uniref:hypothetical protein n=1 Tax=Desulfatirhabdium butyrativorans TaxID=340467 RepID=UPI0003FC12B9|nr:hypothetical protein [Desulfatirhabdium butyrativorans]